VRQQPFQGRLCGGADGCVLLVGVGDCQRRRLDGGEPDLASIAQNEALAVDDAGNLPGCDGCAPAFGHNRLRRGAVRRKRG
jgi:hypothetical protein